jgi:UDP-N-acetyl-alpha-D-quinovosamine dehydrogenase
VILITGANGFVGWHLCRMLSEKRLPVRAAARTAPGPEAVQGVAYIPIGDIGPDTDWAAALAGVDQVIHLAARVHLVDDRAADPLAEFRRINVLGTERLARAAAAAGVRRLVFLSSIKVNGDASAPGRPFTEADPTAPADPYAISKREAEDALRNFAARGAPEIVVLRPPLVYGPGVKANFFRLLGACDGGLPLPLGAARALRSLLYVGNLTDAIVSCLGHPAAAGRTYLLSDGEDISTAELVRRISAALGRPAHLLPVPASLVRLGLALTGRGADADRLFSPLQADSRCIREELGWNPPFSLDAGLRETVRWYREAFAR